MNYGTLKMPLVFLTCTELFISLCFVFQVELRCSWLHESRELAFCCFSPAVQRLPHRGDAVAEMGGVG